MNKISFGLGRSIITPTMKVSLAGYFNPRIVTEVFDDLECRAVVLRKDGTEFLLVQFDLITVSELLYTAVMDAIADLKQFSPENVLLTAVHTHTASDYRPSSPAYDPECIKEIVANAEKAIRMAVADDRTGSAWYGMTSDDRFLFNRRYWLKNGKVMTNPGKLNPEIDRPEGEIDPEIPLFALKDESGKIALLLANIVNHTDTIGGTEVSADWVGFTHRTLEKYMAEGGIMMPLIGASGNINHFDVSTDRPQTQYDEAKRIGLGYAETISAALKDLKEMDDAPIRTFFSRLEIGPAEVSEKELSEARATVEKFKDVPSPAEAGITITSEHLANGEPVALKYFAQVLIRIAEAKRTFNFRLSGVEIGNVMIASLPSEPFVEIGLAIRKEIFSDKTCMVVSHGNGTGNMEVHGGYIPNLWNYDRGGYETEVLSNPFERKTAEKLIATWRKLAGK